MGAEDGVNRTKTARPKMVGPGASERGLGNRVDQSGK